MVGLKERRNFFEAGFFLIVDFLRELVLVCFDLIFFAGVFAEDPLEWILWLFFFMTYAIMLQPVGDKRIIDLWDASNNLFLSIFILCRVSRFLFFHSCGGRPAGTAGFWDLRD